MRSLLFLSVFLPFLSLPLASGNSCSCGYQDPATNLIWTDSIVTYFNESNANIDYSTSISPVPNDYGNSQPSKGALNNSTWVAMSYLNPFDVCWTCIYRHQIASNNTFTSNDSLGLAIQPADTKNHISWGGEIITQRRDILYGSFRAALQAPAPGQGGSIFQFNIAFNASDYLSTSIYSSDEPSNSTFQWSYSSRGHISDPTKNPLSSLGVNGFHEHRMDWKDSNQLQYSNDGLNSSASFLSLDRKRDKVNIPTIGGPVSFKHWSNGEKSQSQGPPIHHQPVARVQYARFFFNSSLPARQSEFEQQCSASPVPICSTEDNSLRDSTPFSFESTQRAVAPHSQGGVKLFAIIAESISGGLFLLLLVHALVQRSLKAKRKDREFTAKNLQPQQEQGEEGQDAGSEAVDVRAEFQKALKAWEDPSLLDYSDSDSCDDSDDDKDLDDPFQMRPHQDLLSFGNGVFDGSSPVYTAPSFHLLTASQTSISPHGSVRGSQINHLQGVDDKLLNLKDGELSSSPSQSSFPHFQRRGSNLSLISVMRDHKNAGFSNLNPFSHDTISSSRLGSMNEFPAAENSSWNGGLMNGIGSTRQVGPTGDPLVSPSHARLLSSRSMSWVHDNGSDSPVPLNWQPKLVEWKPSKQNELQLAERSDGVTLLPEPPVSASGTTPGFAGWIGRAAKKMLVGEGSGGTTASGAAKVEYLDGLRGFACFLVSFHHFMLIFYYNVTTPTGPAHYPRMERWLRNLLGAILTNGGLNVGIFFCLAARVIANRYLVRGRLQDLAEATQRRVPRLMVPISSAIVLCYFLIEADAFHWVARLSSRSWSVWSYYQNYENLGTFIDSYLSLWFTTPPNVPSMISTYATGILWTVPLIISSSWTVFTCALIAYEIPNVKKRYSFYLVCFLLSWYSLKFDYFFIAGLVIADLDNKVKYRDLAAKGFPLFPSFISSRLPASFAKKRIHGQVFAWCIFLTGATVSWLDQVNGVGSDLSNRELGIHPNWQTAQPRSWFDGNLRNYTDPRIFDFFFVIGFFLLCDLCASFRTFFQLRFWSAFGRNAFSLYLLHGVIFWSWGAWISLRLLAWRVIPYWAAILITFLTSYAWLALLCEFFTRTFDKWGVSLSKSFWRECSGGLGRRA